MKVPDFPAELFACHILIALCHVHHRASNAEACQYPLALTQGNLLLHPTHGLTWNGLVELYSLHLSHIPLNPF